MTHGLLIIDKDAGWTSHDVVARVRRLIGQRRVGHAGTLDPMATGVLVLCLGRATRLAEYLQGHRKRYQATIRLGEVTDTYDLEGEVIERHPVPSLSEEELTSHLRAFQGTITQRPPAYSAVKVDGVPAYRRARRGEVVALPPRQVTIYEIRLSRWEPPELSLEIECSAGTYIRSLAHDLGQAIGCGAHLIALRRTASGPFTLADAISLSELERLVEDGRWRERVLPLVEAVKDMPKITLSPQAENAVRFGQPIPGPKAEEGTIAAGLSQSGDLIAILRFDAERELWRPHKVLGVS
jgi:tRNA pseudouridine55 synthase